MRHEITLDEVIAALDTEINIAICSSSKRQASKKLMFNPAALKYTVSHRNSITGERISNSYVDPLIAIEKYNSYDV